MTDRFTDTARIMAEVTGIPGYRFAVIAHPIAPDADDALRAKAAQAVDQIVRLLTGDRSG
jgi:hypothetical protein